MRALHQHPELILAKQAQFNELDHTIQDTLIDTVAQLLYQSPLSSLYFGAAAEVQMKCALRTLDEW